MASQSSQIEVPSRVHASVSSMGKDTVNPVTVTCYCRKCQREAACFENAWWRIGKVHYSPTKEAFYDVQLAGLEERGVAHGRGDGLLANSSFIDLGCKGCGDILGFVCVEAPEDVVMAKGRIALDLSAMRTVFHDYRTMDHSMEDAQLNIVKSFEMSSSNHLWKTKPGESEKYVEENPPAPFYQRRRSFSPMVIETPPEKSNMSQEQVIDSLKEFAQRAEIQLQSQRQDIDRVINRVERIENDSQTFKAFMEQIRFELNSKATTANFQANLQQMGDGIWREIHSLRAQRQNSFAPPQDSDDTVKFTVEEVDALTDSISKINQKASEVDGLKMELQFMKNRLKRLEEVSRPPAQAVELVNGSGPANGGIPATTPPQPSTAPDYRRQEDDQRKRPAEAASDTTNTPNKRQKNLEDSKAVMAAYNTGIAPSGHTVVHPNSPHGQHIQQYTQQLNGGARPGHMPLTRPPPPPNQPVQSNHGFPYVGPYQQPPPSSQPSSQAPQYSSQRSPLQSELGLSHLRPPNMSQPPPSKPVTSQPPHHSHMQPPPHSQPQTMSYQSFSPRVYRPSTDQLSDSSNEQPRRPRGRPRKDGTAPGSSRESQEYQSPYHPPTTYAPQPQPQPQTQGPPTLPPISKHPKNPGTFNVTDIQRPAWLQNSAVSPNVGSFQSGMFKPASALKKPPLMDENGVRLTKKGLPDGRVQNGKALGEWRAKKKVGEQASSNSPAAESKSPSAAEGEDSEGTMEKEVNRQVMQSIESNKAAQETVVREERVVEERELDAEKIIKHER